MLVGFFSSTIIFDEFYPHGHNATYLGVILASALIGAALGAIIEGGKL
jgi:hypothetical protein